MGVLLNLLLPHTTYSIFDLVALLVLFVISYSKFDDMLAYTCISIYTCVLYKIINKIFFFFLFFLVGGYI